MDRCNRAGSILLVILEALHGFCNSEIYDLPNEQDFNEQQQQQHTVMPMNMSVYCAAHRWCIIIYRRMCSSVKYILAVTIWLHFTPDLPICILRVLSSRYRWLLPIEWRKNWWRMRKQMGQLVVEHMLFAFLICIYLRAARVTDQRWQRFSTCGWMVINFVSRRRCRRSSSRSLITNCGWMMPCNA